MWIVHRLSWPRLVIRSHRYHSVYVCRLYSYCCCYCWLCDAEAVAAQVRVCNTRNYYRCCSNSCWCMTFIDSFYLYVARSLLTVVRSFDCWLLLTGIIYIRALLLLFLTLTAFVEHTQHLKYAWPGYFCNSLLSNVLRCLNLGAEKSIKKRKKYKKKENKFIENNSNFCMI